MGHHGEEEADDVDTLQQQGVGHVLGEGRVPEHDRDDGVFAGEEAEAELAHAGAEVSGVGAQALAQIVAGGQKLQGGDAGGGDGGCQRIGEQVGPCLLTEPLNHFFF